MVFVDCLWNMKVKFLVVEVEVIVGIDYSLVIMSRREVFVVNFVKLWVFFVKK